MERITKILETPSKLDLKRGWGGMYKVIIGEHEAYISQETYKKKILEERLYFNYKVPEKVIDEFARAVSDEIGLYEN